jgi:tRNA (guanine9-N1)-methyltransferase
MEPSSSEPIINSEELPQNAVTEEYTKDEKLANDGANNEATSSKPNDDEKEAATAKASTMDDASKTEEVKKISKNQLKRKLKFAQAMEVKRRRKDQERNIKLAKAKFEGRDIEAERKEMEEGRKSGVGWKLRNDKWKERFERNSSKYQICLDCSFESIMTSKEVNSLASQIRYCYASNKRAKHPVTATATNCSGSTLDHLKNVSGFDQWANRAFRHTEEGLFDAYPDKSKLVYLTSDSENILENLEDDKVYIIGGIVDRNRLKRRAIDRAEELGVATAKLPISNYLSMVTTQVLTCNHVFEVLLKYREHGNDWKKAFLDVLPVRKDAIPKIESNES